VWTKAAVKASDSWVRTVGVQQQTDIKVDMDGPIRCSLLMLECEEFKTKFKKPI
jgi:hypothetical protein